jgi:hypothetical protein
MIKHILRLLSVVKYSLIIIHILFAIFYVIFIIPMNGPFLNVWFLLFYGLLALNLVLGILATLKELFATEVISVILTLIAIISCFIIDHHLAVCLSLLIIFMLTFIFSILLFLKSTVLINFNDRDVNQQNGEEIL